MHWGGIILDVCQECGGQGWFWVMESPIEGSFQSTCESCDGTGEVCLDEV